MIDQDGRVGRGGKEFASCTTQPCSDAKVLFVETGSIVKERSVYVIDGIVKEAYLCDDD
jgi:hypothetical protein